MRTAFGFIGFAALTALCLAQPAFAGPIYVYKDGGATVFSSSPPPAGVNAQVFTAKNSGFSVYRARSDYHFSEAQSQAYDEIIRTASAEHAVDQSLVKAVIHAESAFNPRAISRKGALGLMQLMPERARLLGVRRPLEPEANIRGGVRHLAFLLRKYNGNLKLTLAAYNAGEGAVEQYGGIPPFRETRQYVQKVLQLKDRYGRLITRAQRQS